MQVGPVARVGWVRAWGEPLDPLSYDGRSADAPTFSLGARVVTRVELTTKLLLVGDLEGGYELAGIDARFEGERAAAVQGPMLHFSLGVAYAL